MVLGFRVVGFRGQGLGLGFVKRSIRPYAGVPTLLKFEIGFRFHGVGIGFMGCGAGLYGPCKRLVIFWTQTFKTGKVPLNMAQVYKND